MNSELVFQSSPFYVPVCLLVGAVYSYSLYKANAPWSKIWNYILATLRFVSVSILCFLLLGIMLRLVTQSLQKKTIVFAIDNSQSVGNHANIVNNLLVKLKDLKTELLNKDYEVEVQTLKSEQAVSFDSLQFNQNTTNLSEMLTNLKNNYEGSNVIDVVLLSDGIYNQGIAPTFGQYPFPIHTIGIGDTIPKRDIALRNVFANKIAYLGNQFPIQADVVANGFAGKTASVLLKQGATILDTKVVSFPQNDAIQTVNFTTTAKTKGLQHYTIEVQVLAGEFTPRNNRQEVYIEVIDGKQKILLLALAPHPDIKAIKSILDKNENYETDVKVLGQYLPNEQEKKYDLLIVHQLPDFFSTGNDVLQKYIRQDVPIFYILANQSSTAQLNGLQSFFQINSGAGQTDKVSGYFNQNFKQLNFSADKMELIRKLPPVSVPFGEYKLMPNTEVVLYQKVGNVPTQKPLLIVNTGAKKGAMFLGEGLWQWRMEEFALTEKQEVIDDLFMKVVQYISAKNDKRKLRVYPLSTEVLLGEKVSFETEVYNDIYEKLYDQQINLSITDEKGMARNYSYATTESNSRFDISGLPQGVYRYKAIAKVLGKEELSTGEFVVKDLQLEALHTTADFGILKQLSQQTGGKFYNNTQIEQLKTQLLSHNAPDKIDSTEELKELINLRWLIILILLLSTIEWTLRKYWGGY
jgi:hypothetical protein